MLFILCAVVVAAGLLLLIGIACGKFCQLSNDDKDDFRQEWKGPITFHGRNHSDQGQHCFTASKLISQQSDRVVELRNIKRTKTRGKIEEG